MTGGRRGGRSRGGSARVRRDPFDDPYDRASFDESPGPSRGGTAFLDPYDDPYDSSPAEPQDRYGRPLRRKRRRPWGRALVVVLVLLVAAVGGGYFYLDSRLKRETALAGYAGRPADTPGTNWLIVGSDSRAGLSSQDRKRLATGSAFGRRTDSMMLLHSGSGGATLVSLPRDSFVKIPGHTPNKLNAAFAFGGPQLLVRTVEEATGIHIDHYAEIGFGGFVGVVDAVGGVRMCVKQPMKDPKAGLNLKPGCQTLNGAQALGFVRTRATARADLDRVQNQRAFFGALINRATDPAVMLNPMRSVPLAVHASENFSVDGGDHLQHLMRLMWAMRGITGGSGVTTTVPVGGFGSSPQVGSYLIWDKNRAPELFNALKADRPVPRNLVTR